MNFFLEFSRNQINMKSQSPYLRKFLLITIALFLTTQALAQSDLTKSHFLTGFLNGCKHSQEFLKFEHNICRNSSGDNLQTKNCKKGEIILSQNIKAVADFKFHKDYYEYVLKFEPGTMMFGPLDVSVLSFFIGNSNGISASELKFRDIKTAKEAIGLLQKNSLKIRKSVNEMGDEVAPKLHQSKTRPVSVTIACDLSN